MTLTRFPRIWPPLALALLALAVRLHNLTYHSLWFDEAMSVFWARSSVSRILEVSMSLVEDRLPPLYYLSLHYWRLLFSGGELSVTGGEVVVRFPSVVLGVLLVPVVYRLCADFFDRHVGTLAALLAAFNPFLVWYSQEARMYAQAVLLSTLGTWFFLSVEGNRLSRRRRVHFWLAYGLCALAGLYTHLYTGFLLVAHALYLLLTARRSRRAWLPFALTMLGVAALFVPLALATWRASSEAGPGDPLTGFWSRGWWLLSALTLWKAPLPPGLNTFIPAAIAGFAVLGLLFGVQSMPSHILGLSKDAIKPRIPSTPRPALLVALLLLTPFVIATLLLFHNRVAFFGERYFIVMLPWLLIAAAAGAAYISDLAHRLLPAHRALRLAQYALRTTHYALRNVSYTLLLLSPSLLLVALTLIPLPGQWSPAARKEAWRETVDYLAIHAQPDDAILIHPDWTRFPLQYYFRGPGQTYAVFGSVEDQTDLDSPLTVISDAHPVVWLIESHTEQADPNHRANAWLAARYPQVTELYPPGLAGVHAYAPGYLSNHLPDVATPLDAVFEGGIQLLGYTLPQTQTRAADYLFHPPSGWLHSTLYWTVDVTPAQDYTPFVHMVDDMGQIWGVSLDRPNDAFDFYPTTRWEPGQVIRADFDVNLNPLTPQGRYTLVVGLRDASGAQVSLAGGALQASLGSVEILP